MMWAYVGHLLLFEVKLGSGLVYGVGLRERFA